MNLKFFNPIPLIFLPASAFQRLFVQKSVPSLLIVDFIKVSPYSGLGVRLDEVTSKPLVKVHCFAHKIQVNLKK